MTGCAQKRLGPRENLVAILASARPKSISPLYTGIGKMLKSLCIFSTVQSIQNKKAQEMKLLSYTPKCPPPPIVLSDRLVTIQLSYMLWSYDALPGILIMRVSVLAENVLQYNNLIGFQGLVIWRLSELITTKNSGVSRVTLWIKC